MPESRVSIERIELLADVAEMYYIEQLNQADIARRIGLTRSMVSRLLSEAHRQGIVHISITRPLVYDRELEARLVEHFGLAEAHVVAWQPDEPALLKQLGAAGAEALRPHLRPGICLGLPWGTTVSAVVDALAVDQPIHLNVIQLVGALGAQNLEYDGHGVVQRLAQKLDGNAYYINAPFLMESPETVRAILANKGVQETMELGARCDVALLGIGCTIPEFSSYYHAGYLQISELDALRATGAVGGVCGLHFDAYGQPAGLEFQNRCVTLSREDLKRVPVRLAVAGGAGKAISILGALRSGLINRLVTDKAAAAEALRLESVYSGPG